MWVSVGVRGRRRAADESRARAPGPDFGRATLSGSSRRPAALALPPLERHSTTLTRQSNNGWLVDQKCDPLALRHAVVYGLLN